jgi:hypothetical protein
MIITNKPMIEIAQEAGIISGFDTVHPSIERFFELVCTYERNACSDIVEDEIKRAKPVYSPTADIIFRRIRERGQA